MLKTKFIGSSLEQCIGDACKLFDVEKDKLDYKIIKKKKGLFIKKVVIEAKPIEEKVEEVIKEKEVEEIETYNIEEKAKKENYGTVKIKNGELIVKNPKKDGKPANIVIGEDSEYINVKVDGQEVVKRAEIYEHSTIEVSLYDQVASRKINISTSKDNIEAFASVYYEPEIIYELKDSEENNELILEKVSKYSKMPPKYTVEEIKEQLSKGGIICGIIEENLQNVIEKSCDNVLIAKGVRPIHEKDDVIEYRFNVDEREKKLEEDAMGNVDFKSIGTVEAVKKGDILAIRHSSKPGRDGVDVKGKLLKHKLGKKIRIRAGNGCQLSGEKIIASIEGKPYVKNNAFYVYRMYEVRSDVDLTTGNIEFIGDVLVYGNVKEGMEVNAGNSITINKNVERSKIEGKGNITIKGSILSSDILGGGQDVTKIKAIDNSKALINLLREIIESTKEVKRLDLYGKDKKDGEIIRILMERKYKTLPRTCLNIIRDITVCGKDQEEGKIILAVKNKLIGLAPLNIKNYRELEDIIKLLEERVVKLEKELTIPIDVIIDYCQDSNISSSGNVYITGKGEYISNIVSNNSIYFTSEKGLARGGQIKAKKEIRCKTVGSISGVTTKLIVGDKGEIWADIAYQNTVFKVGTKEYLLEMPSKDIHVYLDKNGDIIADKLLL
ncbi:serine/threonine protein phosphatase [Clostridium tetani]|nr:serine/threonine protein phosphatase [Clostridium tetani]RXI45867.1 serine/threonine protein phosphatase [Clostridium tetani]RXI61922.1 serine/threonine protein phosphatase [Clostridium tetani]RXI63967.1 serine/threonine protein phosphatase [Clostridium tetani]RXI65618.1 serine/threonine protein phosphatase [Clostridium tetani]